MQCQALVAEAHVRVAAPTDLLGLQETPSTQAVGDRNTDDGLADLDSVVDNEGEVVALVSRAALEAEDSC